MKISTKVPKYQKWKIFPGFWYCKSKLCFSKFDHTKVGTIAFANKGPLLRTLWSRHMVIFVTPLNWDPLHLELGSRFGNPHGHKLSFTKEKHTSTNKTYNLLSHKNPLEFIINPVDSKKICKSIILNVLDSMEPPKYNYEVPLTWHQWKHKKLTEFLNRQK